MLVEAQRNGDSTLEEMTDSQASYADPSDRATAESDRAFTLRIRDRERKLITKIKEALQRMEDGEYGICEECGEDISLPASRPALLPRSAFPAKLVRKKAKKSGAAKPLLRKRYGRTSLPPLLRRTHSTSYWGPHGEDPCSGP